MENLLTEGAAVNLDDSVFFNLSIRFPSLAALFAEVGVCVTSGKGRIAKKEIFANNMQFFVKVFFTV